MGESFAPGTRLGPWALLLAISLGAQQTPPVFRGGTTIVPLDVKVLDKRGKPVTDLEQSDFTVYEDNVKQDIRSFFPQTFKAQPVPEGDGPALIRAGRSDPLAPQTRRTFLLVLGWDRTQGARVHGPGRPPEGALRFVRERLLPQDLVSVMAFNRATDFTTDHARIETVLERYRRDYERIVFEAVEFQERHPRMPLPAEIQASMDAIFTGQTPAAALASLKAARAPADTHTRNVADLLLRIDPALSRRASLQRNEPSFDDVQDFSGRVLHLSLSDAVAQTDLIKVYAGIEYLRHLDGEKHLVFLGRRVAFEHKEDDERLAARANDARVALDIIHTAGIEASEGGFGRGGGRLDFDDLRRVSSAENLAERSGGYYTGVITADKALTHLDESTRFSYLLGYAPTNPVADGTLRQVRVRVNRPDVTVVFHQTYSAVETISPVDLKDLIVTSRLAAGGGHDAEARDIRLQARASPLPRLGVVGQLRVEVTIDASRLAFEAGPGGRVAELDVEVFCGDDKKQVVGDLKQRLNITADDETYARFLRDGIPFTARISAAGAVKYVKIVVYDPGADLMGTFVVTMGK